MTMAVDGSSQGGAAAEEEYRHRLRELLRANSGMLMNVLESAAGAEDKELMRMVIEASLFIFSADEDALPGGKDFWARMRANITSGAERLPPAEARSRKWKSVGYLRRELYHYASERPELKKVLDDFDRRFKMPVLSPTAAPPAPPAPVVPAPFGQAAAIEAELSSIQSRYLRPQAEPASVAKEPGPAPPFAQVILPAPHSEPVKQPGIEELRAKLDEKESELRRKDSLLKEYDEDMRRIHEQLNSQDSTPDVRALEEKLAIQEEDTRIARADLAKLEKKYHENLDLLKEEARDRGSLQKQLDTAQGDVQRAQERLKVEQDKLADTRTRLDRREKELELVEERLHAMELELVRKEEEIKMAMQHLRDEEAERRRVLETLRQETREKAQMEHRLKRREEELSRLEARIVEEEKRIEALKGSQAITEEEALRKAGELRKREEEVRAIEARTQGRMDDLQREEAQIKERIARLKKDLRDGEVLEAQLKKREELGAALEARYRQKEDELLRELKEIERARAGMEQNGGGTGSRERGAGAPASGSRTGEEEGGMTTSRASEKAAGEGTAAERPSSSERRPPPLGGGSEAPPIGWRPPALAGGRSPETSPKAPPERQPEPVIPTRMKKTLVVPRPHEPLQENGRSAEGGSATTPDKLFTPLSDRKDKMRDEILDMLSKKIRTK
jgi:hypothetical protein